MAAFDWNSKLLDQLTWHWDRHVRPRLDGLADEEYFWEPVPRCWSLRSREEAQSAAPVGAGDLVLDLAWPDPVPPPVTTIAWRLGHVIVAVFGQRNAAHFGGPPMDLATARWAPTAEAALADLEEGYRCWVAGARALGEEGLARPVGPAEGPVASHPYAELVLHIHREAIHHLAEVLTLRDLYRARV